MHRKSPSKIWRKFGNRYALKGVKSKATGKSYFPPILFESGNKQNEFQIVKYKKSGKLISWSIVNAPPNGFEYLKPYVVAIIELEDGQRLTSQVVDINPSELLRGDVLIPTFRKVYADGEDGIIHYGLKWTKP